MKKITFLVHPVHPESELYLSSGVWGREGRRGQQNSGQPGYLNIFVQGYIFWRKKNKYPWVGEINGAGEKNENWGSEKQNEKEGKGEMKRKIGFT